MHVMRGLIEGAIAGAVVAAVALAIFDGSWIGWLLTVSVLGAWVVTRLLGRLPSHEPVVRTNRPERVSYSGWDAPPREEQRAQEDPFGLRTRQRRPPYLLELTSIVVGIAAGVAAVASVFL